MTVSPLADHLTIVSLCKTTSNQKTSANHVNTLAKILKSSLKKPVFNIENSCLPQQQFTSWMSSKTHSTQNKTVPQHKIRITRTKTNLSDFTSFDVSTLYHSAHNYNNKASAHNRAKHEFSTYQFPT